MKMLLGIHCNDFSFELMSSLTVREELHLLAYHLHTPALEAAAVLAKVNAHELQKRPQHYSQLAPWNQSADNIFSGISKLLLAGNPNAFIDNADAWLNNSLNSPLRNMFNGHLIYGVSTEQEAQFIRNNGGMLIHIINTEKPRKIDIQQGEMATYCVRGEQPSSVSLKTIAKCVREHFKLQTQAQAEAA